MPGALQWGWCPETKKWVRLRVDDDGSIHVVGYVDELDDIGDVNVPVLVDGDFLEWDSTTSKWIKIAHKDATTGVHGVGADYVAIADASQYTAVNRAGDTGLGTIFRRGVDNSALTIMGGGGRSALLSLYGQDHATYPSYLQIKVSNAAKTAPLTPIWISGVTDTPEIYPHSDNHINLGTAAKRWKEIFGVTITEGDHGFMDKECAICHNPLKVGDPIVYQALANHLSLFPSLGFIPENLDFIASKPG
ncbi:unnamed protein product [marine sediment metagenome]|uniref:Uncharacterized protein n=1 Tax=marine sediment metagenome TaxID=412755 RepID=X1RG84_9ZZZZ